MSGAGSVVGGSITTKATEASALSRSGDFANLTTNDYKLARLSHWLRGYNNAAVVTDTISMTRDPSVDGSTDGQMHWLNYAGKVTNWWTRGTNAQPSLGALVRPNGETRFTGIERTNRWEYPTHVTTSFTSGGGTAQRTSFLIYTNNGIDLIEFRGPSNELLSSNYFNGFHQVLTNYNAAGDMTIYQYGTDHKITSVQLPTSLVTTYSYYTSGANTGWLFEKTAQGFGTSTFDYANGLLATSRDERGLYTVYSWDQFMRLTAAQFPSGTASLQYNRLDLQQTTSPSGGSTVQFQHDAMRQLGIKIDARGTTNGLGYSYGLLTSITNALGQTNGFTYDLNGQLLSTIFHDKSAATNRYNLLGELTNQVDAAGVSLTNWYNNQGLVSAVSNAFGRVVQYQYDVRDRATNVLDGNGVTTSITYDNANRIVTRGVTGGGSEGYGYNSRGVASYTNQLGFVTKYGYDVFGHKTAETNANGEVTSYTYNNAGDLASVTDAKGHQVHWDFDEYGRVIIGYDSTGNEWWDVTYDADGRATNRFTVAKGGIAYSYDANGNVTNVNHVGFPSTPNVTYYYDALNRVTNMVDGIGTTRFTYTSFGTLETEDGPWSDDTVTHYYTTNHLLSAVSLVQPSSSTWVTSFGYDGAKRLQSVTSPAGNFAYAYSAASLMNKLTLPTGSYVTNLFDSLGRLTGTYLKNSGNAVLDSEAYVYNNGNQRTKLTRTEGSYVDYTYDNIGQLRTAVGREADTTLRIHENFAYGYDAAGNLAARTNNALVQTFGFDGDNFISSVGVSGTITVSGTTSASATSVTVNGGSASRYADKTFAKRGLSFGIGNNTYTAVAQDTYGRSDTNTVTDYYPSNFFYAYDRDGNLTSVYADDYAYDAEDRLWTVEKEDLVTSTSLGKSEFLYDGQNRLRIRREYASDGTVTNEVRYVYDGRLVLQERDGNNNPKVTYTRGWDLSGNSCDGAGGIGGLLARTDNSLLAFGSGDPHAYYHSDGNGNVTALENTKQALVARYVYGPFGNTIGQAGPLADANVYRFSSKEYCANSGLYSFGRRFYDPSLQRWLNRDPLGIQGGVNLYAYVGNRSVNAIDAWGQEPDWFPDYNPLRPEDGPIDMTSDAVDNGIRTGLVASWNIINPLLQVVIPELAVAEVVGAWGWSYFSDEDTVADQRYRIEQTALLAASAIPGGRLVNVQLVRKVEKIVEDGRTFIQESYQLKKFTRIKPSQIDRAAFKAEREAYWMAEAKKNPGNYSAENLERMRRGRAPIGSDGFPIELHHKDRTPTGGVDPMTRTDHRLGDNYKRNHP